MYSSDWFHLVIHEPFILSQFHYLDQFLVSSLVCRTNTTFRLSIPSSALRNWPPSTKQKLKLEKNTRANSEESLVVSSAVWRVEEAVNNDSDDSLPGFRLGLLFSWWWMIKKSHFPVSTEYRDDESRQTNGWSPTRSGRYILRHSLGCPARGC